MTVGVVTQGQTAVVTLSEEASSNAFDAVSMAAISAELTRLMDDSEIRSIVITGSGRVFCAGADIQSFKSAIEDGTAADLVATLTGILHPLLVRMRADPTVIVAAMNGAAAGGGLGLALACDVRIASTKARLASAFFRLGLSPDGGTTWLLPRLVGLQNRVVFCLKIKHGVRRKQWIWVQLMRWWSLKNSFLVRFGLRWNGDVGRTSPSDLRSNC